MRDTNRLDEQLKSGFKDVKQYWRKPLRNPLLDTLQRQICLHPKHMSQPQILQSFKRATSIVLTDIYRISM